jgi:hypothetical protein
MSGVAFVAHCLLNQNAKVYGGARCPGVYSPLVDALRADGWRMEQMPCPELAFAGINRFWAVREQYDTAAYRRHCKRIATALAGAIYVHVREGRDVVLVGIEAVRRWVCASPVPIRTVVADQNGPRVQTSWLQARASSWKSCGTSWRRAASPSPASSESLINCPTTTS